MTALAIDNSDVLGKYKGLPITRTVIVVNKLGDGLSDAVSIEPIVIEIGEDAYLVSKVRKTKERYDIERNKAGEPENVVLVQIFDSLAAMFTDEKAARAGIVTVLERIQKAKDDAKGQLGLDLEGLDEPENNISHLPTAKRQRDKVKEIADKVDGAMGKK